MSSDFDPGEIEGEVAELLTVLIRNACVNDGSPESGGESRSVSTLQDYLGEAGNVHTFQPDRGNLVYRIPGAIPGAPSLGLMGHLDVVPARTAGWSRDPFGGEVVDGEVWGRGAVDMLNMTAAMAVVFKRFLDGTWNSLPGDLVFLAVADEEAGARYGAEPLVEEHWEEVGCDHLLTEVPLAAVAGPDGPVYPVTVGEKGPFWRVLRTTGTPNRRGVPRRPNANRTRRAGMRPAEVWATMAF